MFDVRHNEPQYALLDDPVTEEANRYGSLIDLAKKSGLPMGASLNINGDAGVGPNPNRNKQHGFHFTADNCIGCHACEAACSEKNDLPAHLSFRAVGYVEGGTYPDFTRMNISMACNHCDDPVCLKGCPTRAYTKFAEYGAVLQDPEICFGCGYCTWVCPYNAPQLDPVEGHVQKCNMCVDRLEVGLKPACVSACLGGALDFGVIENTPKQREQIETTIPGFPTPDITHPNIRFQQTKGMPREFTRIDSAPVKYCRSNGTDVYRPMPDAKSGQARAWNLGKLNSHENPLVLFTLTTQAAVGAFLLTFLGPLFGFDPLAAIGAASLHVPFLILLAGLQVGVLALSTLHLGKPLRFYRGFNNLRHSPLSREALGVSLFLNCLAVHALLSVPANGFTAWFDAAAVGGFLARHAAWLDLLIVGQTAGVFAALAALCGLAGLYFMHAIYRIEARPYWNHWQVLTAFFGNMATLGALFLGSFTVLIAVATGAPVAGNIAIFAAIMAAGMAAEGIGHIFHARDLARGGGEGAASHYVETTTFGKTYFARNAMLALNLAAALALTYFAAGGWWSAAAWSALAASTVLTALVSRALFYVLVIPTTMPGAFFWRNKGFEEHARETGLANWPQVGIAAERRNWL